jgi:hypothetical protein
MEVHFLVCGVNLLLELPSLMDKAAVAVAFDCLRVSAFVLLGQLVLLLLMRLTIGSMVCFPFGLAGLVDLRMECCPNFLLLVESPEALLMLLTEEWASCVLLPLGLLPLLLDLPFARVLSCTRLPRLLCPISLPGWTSSSCSPCSCVGLPLYFRFSPLVGVAGSAKCQIARRVAELAGSPLVVERVRLPSSV